MSCFLVLDICLPGQKVCLYLLIFLAVPVYSKCSIIASWIIYIQQMKQKEMTFFCNELRETGLKKHRHEEEEKMNEGT